MHNYCIWPVVKYYQKLQQNVLSVNLEIIVANVQYFGFLFLQENFYYPRLGLKHCVVHTLMMAG